ncbi:hypothetical protein J7481_22830 [Labrenzia sp. R4_2]|uniref:hypothetical protein n=1 Tax=Labrenzia sp. R4_2 TaxID=2821107 RepID=UPI001ADB173C|nr:hypothetical protein [Labrenzia sp. R4_2]MBO9422364.1 hypothetical protein [Labrenzia sp. R4_2]
MLDPKLGILNKINFPKVDLKVAAFSGALALPVSAIDVVDRIFGKSEYYEAFLWAISLVLVIWFLKSRRDKNKNYFYIKVSFFTFLALATTQTSARIMNPQDINTEPSLFILSKEIGSKIDKLVADVDELKDGQDELIDLVSMGGSDGSVSERNFVIEEYSRSGDSASVRLRKNHTENAIKIAVRACKYPGRTAFISDASLPPSDIVRTFKQVVPDGHDDLIVNIFHGNKKFTAFQSWSPSSGVANDQIIIKEGELGCADFYSG